VPCSLHYIPKRLHARGRQNINKFYVGEYLFRRCEEADKLNPFLKISLVDLSVNRSGKRYKISKPEDVLYNTNPQSYGGAEILDLSIAFLKISELDKTDNYNKSYTHTKPGINGGTSQTNTCKILLKHKKEECNYAHSAFEIYYDNTEQTFSNYSKLLQRNNPLKSWCKNEIAKMIVKEEVRLNWTDNLPFENFTSDDSKLFSLVILFTVSLLMVVTLLVKC